jgi:hypothetical protein
MHFLFFCLPERDRCSTLLSSVIHPNLHGFAFGIRMIIEKKLLSPCYTIDDLTLLSESLAFVLQESSEVVCLLFEATYASFFKE